VGPDTVPSGENVYGTVLDGPYGPVSALALQSPLIDLTAVERGALSFWHYVETSAEEGGQVRVLDEAGEVLAFSEVFAGDSAGWQEVSFSLLRFGDSQTSIVGQKIRLEFRFLSDDATDGDGAGWYIDDVTIN
jgi:hypothetical protein